MEKSDISEEKFAQLVSKAIVIDKEITQKIANCCNVSVSTLGLWSEGKDIPEPKMRVSVAVKISLKMLEILSDIKDRMDELN